MWHNRRRNNTNFNNRYRCYWWWHWTWYEHQNLRDDRTEAFASLPDWEQTQILSSLLRIVALMEAGNVEAGPILTTGPLDATPEKTEAFLDPAQTENGQYPTQ